jgi:hypothetical protein
MTAYRDAASAGCGAAVGHRSAAAIPSVALSPGPTTNTLGAVGGNELIHIEGHKTVPTAAT